jgi:hypothetical protein
MAITTSSSAKVKPCCLFVAMACLEFADIGYQWRRFSEKTDSFLPNLDRVVVELFVDTETWAPATAPGA